MFTEQFFTEAKHRSGLRARKLQVALLLGSTALLPQLAFADTACTTDGTLLACSGDLSMGVAATNPILTLTINDPTGNIAPVSGTVGILYETDTDATLLSDLGDYKINTNQADGIRAGSIDGDVYVNHAGDISSVGGRGIYAFADNGAAVIEGSGDINADLDAISTDPRAGGAAVNWSGDLTSNEARGLFVKADNGAASASGDGKIEAELDAVTIDARGADGNASFIWEGDVTSHSGNAVTVSSDNGAASARGTGTIDAAGYGIDVDARGASGHAVADWTGDITSSGSYGARVYAADGGADIKGSGTVETEDFAFSVETDKVGSNAALTWDGPITSRLGFGALVQTAGGAATIRGSGDVAAGTSGLTADATGGNAQVNWEGGITAGNGTGIMAASNSGGASISGSGTVEAVATGLIARNTSSASSVVNWQGDVTSDEEQGISVFSSSGATSASGNGDVTGKTDAISIINTGNQASALNWTGELDAELGYGAYVFSSNGNVSAGGSGSVSGGLDAFHLETQGDATVALNWTGDLASTVGNAVHATSARGPVSSTTNGTITAGDGGIYLSNGTSDENDNVAVTHTGNITAGGVGVEARSPVAAVSVTVNGDMQTGAHGIFAESRGARTVSVNQTGTMATGNTAIDAYSSTGGVFVSQNGAVTSLSKGISAINEGDSGATIQKTGNLRASGDGLVAASATGETAVHMTGGNLVSGGVGISATTEGDRMVTVDMTGDINAAEEGIVAQSANGQVYATVIGDVTAGLDGVVAKNIGDGEVGVIQTGNVTAGGDGLVAASATGNATTTLSFGDVVATGNGMRVSGFGNLSANVAEGASVMGGAGFAGILFDGGLQNTVTNYGTIANSGGVDAFAILSEDNDTLVVNHGTISGNVRLGPWANGFFNLDQALLETGSELTVGSGNSVTNSGTLSAGGSGNLMTTALDGNLETLGNSTLLLDVDMRTAQTDVFDLTGSAALAGELKLHFSTVRAAPAEYTILTTDLGVLSQSLAETNPFVTTSVTTVNSNKDVKLTITAFDFAPAGLRGVGNIIGDYLDRAIAAGGEGVDEIAASVVNTGGLLAAEGLYTELAPSAYLDNFNVNYLNSLKFSDSMMSCSVPSGLDAPGAEGSCDWTRTTVSHRTQDSFGGLTFETGVVNSVIGIQRAVGDGDWRVGGAFGLMSSQTKSEAGDRSDTSNIQFGASVKYAPGPFTLAAALTSSAGDVNTTRFVTIEDQTQTLSAKTDQRTYNLKLRGSYVQEHGSVYLKPQADLNATLIQSGAFAETGGNAALAIEGMNQTLFSLAPAVELGVTHRNDNGGVLRAFGRMGATFQSKGGVDLTSALATDETGVRGFTLGAGGDTEVLNLGVGVTAFNVGGWSAEAQLNWNIGEHTDEQVAIVKLRTTF